MTPQEMDADLDSFRSHLACCPSYRVERCAHESDDMTALAVFNKNHQRQVALITANDTIGKYKWQGAKILGGQPITSLPFCTLPEAARYVLQCC